MTLQQMIETLRRRIGSPDTTSVSDQVLTDCINTGYRQVANKYRFHMVRKICTVDTIPGEDRYQLPEDCAAVLRIKNLTKPEKLIKWGDRRSSEFKSREHWGVPSVYTRYQEYFELTPTPDAVYTLEIFYKYAIINLAASSDVPVLPESWHHGIVLHSRFVYYDEVANDFTKAAYASQAYDKWVGEQPCEIDEELQADMDSGVALPTLTQGSERLDFNHAD